MSDKDKKGQEASPDVLASAFQERPRRHSSRNRSSFLLILLGCVIIAGGGGMLIWQLVTHATPAASNGTTSSTGAIKPAPTQPSGCGPRLPWDFMNQEVASRLHLSVAQIKTQVLAGKTIQDVATAQRISMDQLHSIEVQILRDAYNKFVSMGCYTQQEADAGFQQDSSETPAELNADFTRYFSHATT